MNYIKLSIVINIYTWYIISPAKKTRFNTGVASEWNKLRKKLKKRACKVGSDMILYKSCWREQHSVTKQVWSLKTEQRVSKHSACRMNAKVWNKPWLGSTGAQMRFLISSDSKWAYRSFQYFIGEFDPGSGRTLAACLIHASRAQEAHGTLRREVKGMSGGRVSNT